MRVITFDALFIYVGYALASRYAEARGAARTERESDDARGLGYIDSK